MIRVALAALVVIGLTIGVVALRENLETRHQRMPATSRLVVEATARVRGPKDTAAPLSRGLVSSCLVEANPRVELSGFEFVTERDFRFVARPALDEPDQRQLRGCLEDLRVPLLQVSVRSMTTKPRAAT